MHQILAIGFNLDSPLGLPWVESASEGSQIWGAQLPSEYHAASLNYSRQHVGMTSKAFLKMQNEDVCKICKIFSITYVLEIHREIWKAFNHIKSFLYTQLNLFTALLGINLIKKWTLIDLWQVPGWRNLEVWRKGTQDAFLQLSEFSIALFLIDSPLSLVQWRGFCFAPSWFWGQL